MAGYLTVVDVVMVAPAQRGVWLYLFLPYVRDALEVPGCRYWGLPVPSFRGCPDPLIQGVSYEEGAEGRHPCVRSISAAVQDKRGGNDLHSNHRFLDDLSWSAQALSELEAL